MTKDEYRSFFASIPYIKFNYFLKIVNISNSNFSNFMRASVNNHFIRLDRLDALYKVVINEFKSKIT